MNLSAKDLQILTEAKAVLAKLTSVPGWDPTGNAYLTLKHVKILLNSWPIASRQWLLERSNFLETNVPKSQPETNEWDTGELPSELPPECNNPHPFDLDKLQASIEELQDIVTATNTDQTVFVEEECSELIKEICKLRRGKGSREHLMEEAVDVITTCLVYNQICGGNIWGIVEGASIKINRAIKRYRDNGEM